MHANLYQSERGKLLAPKSTVCYFYSYSWYSLCTLSMFRLCLSARKEERTKGHSEDRKEAYGL